MNAKNLYLAGALAMLAILLTGCPTGTTPVLSGCVSPTAPAVENKEPVSTPVVGATGRPPRVGPLRTPTTCPSMLPAFWPTGMPPPTRGPAAVKRAIPTDRETCLQMGGFWDIPFCSGQVRPTSIPQPERSCWEVPTTDACQPCSDDSECEGWCTVPTGGQGSPMTGVCSPIARQWQEERFAVMEGEISQRIRVCE